jgi:hypothetical protein
MHTHHSTLSYPEELDTSYCSIVGSEGDDHFKGGRKKRDTYHYLVERTHSSQSSLSNRCELSVVAMLDEMSQAVCPSEV